MKKLLNKEIIKTLIPHRGKFLLLDEVEIDQEKVKGRCYIRKEYCEEHRVLKNQAIFRGADLIDMAAQTLGVGAFERFAPVRSKGKLNLFREVEGKVKWNNPIRPDDWVEVELEDLGLKEMPDGKLKISASGKGRVKDQKVATFREIIIIIG